MKVTPGPALALLCVLGTAEARPAEARPAEAQPVPSCSAAPDNRAFLQECREKAHDAEQAGRLPEALVIYRQAYQRVPTPRLLWPMARLHLSLRQPWEGLDALRRYLNEMPADEIDDAQRQQADQLRRDLERLQQDLAQKAEPRPAPITLAPVIEPPIERPRERFRVWKYVTLGAGLGMVATGASLWALDGRQSCDPSVLDPQGQCPTMLSTTPAAIPLVAVGSAAVVGGVVMFVLDARARPRRPPGDRAVALRIFY